MGEGGWLYSRASKACLSSVMTAAALAPCALSPKSLAGRGGRISRKSYWALVRWYVWCWRQRRRAAEPDQHQFRPTCAASAANGVAQEDADVDAELRVLAAFYEAGKRELP
jgi:hypothetical protein